MLISGSRSGHNHVGTDVFAICKLPQREDLPNDILQDPKPLEVPRQVADYLRRAARHAARTPDPELDHSVDRRYALDTALPASEQARSKVFPTAFHLAGHYRPIRFPAEPCEPFDRSPIPKAFNLDQPVIFPSLKRLWVRRVVSSCRPFGTRDCCVPNVTCPRLSPWISQWPFGGAQQGRFDVASLRGAAEPRCGQVGTSEKDLALVPVRLPMQSSSSIACEPPLSDVNGAHRRKEPIAGFEVLAVDNAINRPSLRERSKCCSVAIGVGNGDTDSSRGYAWSNGVVRLWMNSNGPPPSLPDGIDSSAGIRASITCAGARGRNSPDELGCLTNGHLVVVDSGVQHGGDFDVPKLTGHSQVGGRHHQALIRVPCEQNELGVEDTPAKRHRDCLVGGPNPLST